MEVLDAPELLGSALGELAAHGLSVELLGEIPHGHSDSLADARLRLGWRRHSQEFRVGVKKHLRPATAALYLEKLARLDDSLLIADRVTGEVAHLAREMGVAYADAAGNAWIRASNFLIDVQGRTSTITQDRLPSGFTKTDLRVIIALVTHPGAAHLAARELAQLIGISHGAAHLTTRKLRERGYLSPSGLRRGRSLLDEWTQAYLARGGAHRQSRRGYIDPDIDLPSTLARAGATHLSGELAGSLLGWPIRPTTAVVYASAPTEVARSLRLRSHGDGRAVEVRTPLLGPTDNPPGIAASMVIRADMLTSMDPRQIEVAERALHDDPNLRRLIETA